MPQDILNKLDGEDLSGEEALIEKIAELEAKIRELVAQGKGEKIGTNTIRTHLSRLKEIEAEIELHGSANAPIPAGIRQQFH